MAINEGEIVSYTSVVPVFSTATRPQLSAILGLEAARMPPVDLFEFATGWTQPDYRRKGISLQLRLLAALQHLVHPAGDFAARFLHLGS